ncbi:MAG: hypothetical protein WD512_20255, partial [Candidatus Paceibacterota bacterium]
MGKRKSGKTTMARAIGKSLVLEDTKAIVFTQDSKINYSFNLNTQIYDVYDTQKIKAHIKEKRVGTSNFLSGSDPRK